MVEESFAVAVLAIIATTIIACLPVVLFFWLILRKRPERGKSANDEEKLRHIWNGLQRMEQRIENLETIMAGQRRRDPLDDAARSEDVRAGRLDA